MVYSGPNMTLMRWLRLESEAEGSCLLEHAHGCECVISILYISECPGRDVPYHGPASRLSG